MKKFIKANWIYILSGLGVLFLYFFRLFSLTILPVFADEAIYIRWSQIMVNEPTLRFLPLSDGKQPLYMWILMFLVNRFSDPLFIGRLVSVMSGVGTLVGIFVLSYILFKNKTVSLASSFVYAISPFSFFFDRMALVDSMLCMFGVWTMTFAVLTSKKLRLDYSMITGFFLGFALLTKSPAIFFVILLASVFIFTKNKIKLAILFIPTILIAFGMYNILRLGPNFHLISARNSDYIFPISQIWTNPKDPFIFHIKEIFSDWFIKMGPWPLIVLVFLGLAVSAKKYSKEIIFLSFFFLFPIFVQSMYAKVFTVRYILFTLPPVFIAAGLIFLAKDRLLKIVGYLFFIIFAVLSFKFNYLLTTKPEMTNLPSSEKSGYLQEWTAGQGIREIADYIKNEKSQAASKKIVIGTEGYFGTLPDGLQMYLADNPDVTVIGVGIDIKELPQSLVESKNAGNKTYLVVNKSRLNAHPELLGIRLIAEYPKVPRPDDVREYYTKGPQEFLYFYEVN